MKILLATFYTPGIRAIEYLIQAGFKPDQIRVITHQGDKNHFLLDYASGHGIDIQTFSIKSNDAYAWMSEFAPDVLFSLYFRDIIPVKILEIPFLGCVNLHPALLPKYRGTFSAPWAIINGEEVTGFTYHYMEASIDTGNIILQKQVKIFEDDTAYSLYHRLLIAGMDTFGDAFKLVVEQRSPGEPQIGESSYYSRKIPFGGYIDPSWSRIMIDRFIRAMYFPPFSGARIISQNNGEYEVSCMNDFDRLCMEGKIDLPGDNMLGRVGGQ